MNKITKPIIVSALSALAFGTVGVAGTFALFTDSGETQISAKAGIVSVKATIGDLKTYSAKAASGSSVTDDSVTDEFGGKYNIVDTAVNGTFTNGGTASIDTQTGYLSLDRITPGDRVSFVVTPSTSSNVDVQYRVSYKVVNDSTHNLELAKGLTTRIGANQNQESFEGLEEYRSGWTYAPAVTTSTSLTGIPFEIELPITAGNEYQNKEATIAVTVEGVQGNAAIQDGKYAKAIDKAIETTVSEGTEATELEATNATQTVSVKTIIPANTPEVEAGKSVTLVVGDIAITENADDPDNDDLEFDASLYVNDNKVTSFTNDIHVQVNIGPNLNIVKLTHAGSVVTDFTYNKTTGILDFYTNSFSPFVITYNARNGAYGFYDSYAENGHWVHEIKTPAHFRNIGVASYKYPEVSGGDNVYLLVNDIDFGGVSPWSDGSSWINIGNESEKTIHDFEFNGILDGANHTLSNINLTQEMGPSPAVGDHDYGGLFDSVGVATFKNFTVSHVTINAANAKPGAIIAAGTKKATSEITFDHVTVDDSCRIDGQQGCAAFLGYARSASKMHFSYCTNEADIVVTGSNVGAFMGSLSGGPASRSIRFDHCVNSGDISGYNLIGSFYGSNSDNGTVVFDTCQNTGNVTTFSGTDAGLFIGKYHSLTKFTFTNTTNTGTLYAANAAGVKTTNAEFTSGTFTTAAAAQAFVQGFAALSPTIDFDDANKLVIGGLDDHKDDYDYAIVTISLGPIDTFRLSDSYMIASGGDTVATQQVTDVANVNLKKLTKAGWFAPTATTPTGAFQGDAPSGGSQVWFDYYKIPFELKGTQGYENGYHTTADGSYYIISNENCVDSFTQIMNGHTSISYKVVLYKNINNKNSIVGFKEKTDSCYGVVGANPNPYLLPYYTGE